MQLSELFIQYVLLSVESLQATRQLYHFTFQWRHSGQV